MVYRKYKFAIFVSSAVKPAPLARIVGNPAHFQSVDDIRTEDIAIDRESKYLFVSNLNLSEFLQNRKESHGAILSYNLKSKQLKKLPIKNLRSGQFNPHGISFFHDHNNDVKYLFVINHKLEGDSVISFKIQYGLDDEVSLTFLEEFQNADMISLNDLHAFGKNSFVATNDHNVRNPVLGFLTDLFGIPYSSVILVKNGKNEGKVLNFVSYANSAHYDAKKDILYVAHTVSKLFSLYRFNGSRKAELIQSVNLNTMPDNVEVDESGDIWLGSHPKIFKFLQHLGNAEKLSPSQCIKVSLLDSGLVDKFETVYYNNGSEISASSTCLRFEDTLFISSVTNFFLECKMDNLRKI
ncbi:hypothetical protein HDU92_001249 [Lobulomyces angularis]|nr:hypothetical protein HDU92_001249 [Lobulomyces angularis]